MQNSLIILQRKFHPLGTSPLLLGPDQHSLVFYINSIYYALYYCFTTRLQSCRNSPVVLFFNRSPFFGSDHMCALGLSSICSLFRIFSISSNFCFRNFVLPIYSALNVISDIFRQSFILVALPLKAFLLAASVLNFILFIFFFFYIQLCLGEFLPFSYCFLYLAYQRSFCNISNSYFGFDSLFLFFLFLFISIMLYVLFLLLILFIFVLHLTYYNYYFLTFLINQIFF